MGPIRGTIVQWPSPTCRKAGEANVTLSMPPLGVGSAPQCEGVPRYGVGSPHADREDTRILQALQRGSVAEWLVPWDGALARSCHS